MGCVKFILLPLLVGGTLLASVATFSRWGVADIEHPQEVLSSIALYEKRRSLGLVVSLIVISVVLAGVVMLLSMTE